MNLNKYFYIKINRLILYAVVLIASSYISLGLSSQKYTTGRDILDHAVNLQGYPETNELAFTNNEIQLMGVGKKKPTQTVTKKSKLKRSR